LRRARQFALAAASQQLDREVALRHAAHLGQELVGEDRDVGLLQPGRGEDVDHPSGATAREMICRMAWSMSLFGPRVAGRAWRARRTAWKKPTSSRMRSASSCGTASANALRQLATAASSAPCRLLRQDVLLRRRQQPGAAAACRSSRRPVEAVEEAAADLVLLQHHRHGLFLVERRLAGAAALGVGRQRLLQLVGEAQVVHDQAAGLVLEHAVHAGDGLHQPVAAHRLVDVHRVQARRVEAGQPHVAHDDELERVFGSLEALGQRLAPRLVADVRLPVAGSEAEPVITTLIAPLLVVVVVPVGAQRDDLA
jgi:hypothetical protein